MNVLTPLQPYLIYAKIAGVLAVVAAGYYFGGLSKADELDRYKTAVEAQHAVQLQAVVNSMGEHDKQAAAHALVQQQVIDDLHESELKPLHTVGIVERMRVIETAACTASGGQLPGSGALAGGAAAAAGVPASLQELDRLRQLAFDAASRDSKRLNAMTKLAPQLLP